MSRPRRLWSTDSNLTALLLFLCLSLFVVHPLEGVGVTGRLVLSVFFSLILISAVAAVASHTRMTIVVGTIVVATFAMRWLRLWIGGPSLALSDAGFSALFCIVTAAVVLAQVFREGPITSHRIQGAVAVYLLIGFACAFGYEFIHLRHPDAFAWSSGEHAGRVQMPFLYFSFVTLTTIGYGDITAVQPFARSLVMIEGLAGQLFPAILLARLVSMELYHRRAKGSEHL